MADELVPRRGGGPVRVIVEHDGASYVVEGVEWEFGMHRDVYTTGPVGEYEVGEWTATLTIHRAVPVPRPRLVGDGNETSGSR